ncbi:MAG: 1-deoxy-D-xylulose-5-phosphate synthase [Coriobacteriales bacterium]|jgi:1-deoxy-D-xylulose-5-phosphate synthase|nr:1-deoxy-D-xylulose-5-phosphate synthase [Coriobacteriales bacterium]
MTASILENIHQPSDIASLTPDALNVLAHEIRERLVQVTSVTGGHLASSLGAIEIILALHKLFDFSTDRLLFDVGHQSYAHKLITGRNNRFDTLRTFGGICGFPRRDESIYDAYDAGHASDSLSIAAGMALARDLKGTAEQIVAIIGDASLSGGMAFEALNHIGHECLDVNIVLNDNEMSISRNVGALSLYLGKIRTSKPYTHTRDTLESGLSRVGKLGRVLVGAGELAKSSVKKLLVPGMFFEDMGIKYIGPIDGHNIAALLDALAAARSVSGPVIIHAVTRKGSGYAPAERMPDVFHGVGAFNGETGELVRRDNSDLLPTYTQVFANALCEEARINSKLVAITAAMTDGTGLKEFSSEFPQRFFDVGIAEEHAVGFAAGMALGGLLPVCAIYSTFLQRAYDQMLIDVAQQKQHVVFAIDRAGLVGEDGQTHNGAFDLAYLSSIPGMRILAPASADDLRDSLHTALALNGGPVAVRYPRGTVIKAPTERCPKILPFGKARLVRIGNWTIDSKDTEVPQIKPDVAILAIGRFVSLARQVSDLLADEHFCTLVYNMIWAKPLDVDAIKHACSADLVVTLEDGSVSGGFGSSVAGIVSKGFAPLDKKATKTKTPPLMQLGLPDSFTVHGKVEALFEHLGLTPEVIAADVKTMLGK